MDNQTSFLPSNNTGNHPPSSNLPLSPAGSDLGAPLHTLDVVHSQRAIAALVDSHSTRHQHQLAVPTQPLPSKRHDNLVHPEAIVDHGVLHRTDNVDNGLVLEHSQRAHPLEVHIPQQPNFSFLTPTNELEVPVYAQQHISQNLLPRFQSPPPQIGPHQLEDSPYHNDDGQFKNSATVLNPPDLQTWREKLFNVEDTLLLSEEEFQTYFPHVDNVYSHRSTQKYKRKPFVSHYWDCRLKGRPPGTPKTHDPSKKKRKRTARERNLCDVKIKITEYFPGSMCMSQRLGQGFEAISSTAQTSDPLIVPPSNSHLDGSQPFGVLTPSPSLPPGHPGATGARYYTIQRVNGNGGNGRSDAVQGPHRHTLEDSDRIKKNSVLRALLKEEKEKKKSISQPKTYHQRASGSAFSTVNDHMNDSDLKLYGSCFCPFVQRVWIALEVKGIPYQYIEVDPYNKPDSLLEVNPRGLVPAIRHGNWGGYESTVLLEYLEDLDVGKPLLPLGDPQLRAHCRLWVDHINRHIIPCFYRLLQEQDLTKQMNFTEELKDHVSKLVNASNVHGPFFLGSSISFVDIHFAPWMLRLSRVLKPYRGWPDPEEGSRWASWMEAVERDGHIRATTSADDLYLDSYQRYAEHLVKDDNPSDLISKMWMDQKVYSNEDLHA
ncbi:hypothetical protein FQN57_003366 [Myotisia sp. PD_48]|nr:hypothetical protein FQN57_003366 [Myotisia sp. PD_48]